jgi:hypothetical protein
MHGEIRQNLQFFELIFEVVGVNPNCPYSLNSFGHSSQLYQESLGIGRIAALEQKLATKLTL